MVNYLAMDVHFMSQAAPDRPNEDFVLASNDWCLVLDGATELEGIDSGCRHGVRWYVSRLALCLGSLLTADSHASLADILEESIEDVSRLHEDTCDLSNPDSPSSVVLMVREREEFVDYLALGDSAIVVDIENQGQHVILDDRTAHLPSYKRKAVRHLRNSDDGFWVASTSPEAAKHALTGSVPKPPVRSITLLTDGAYRLVERFDWSLSAVIELAKKAGPSEVIHEVRRTEAYAKPSKGKLHDDATVAFVWFKAGELPTIRPYLAACEV